MTVLWGDLRARFMCETMLLLPAMVDWGTCSTDKSVCPSFGPAAEFPLIGPGNISSELNTPAAVRPRDPSSSYIELSSILIA